MQDWTAQYLPFNIESSCSAQQPGVTEQKALTSEMRHLSKRRDLPVLRTCGPHSSHPPTTDNPDNPRNNQAKTWQPYRSAQPISFRNKRLIHGFTLAMNRFQHRIPPKTASFQKPFPVPTSLFIQHVYPSLEGSGSRA